MLVWCIVDVGCNLFDVCVFMIGVDSLLVFVVSGVWDVLVKFENVLGKLVCDEDMYLVYYCMQLCELDLCLLFYLVEVVSVDCLGILVCIVEFFYCNCISVEQFSLMCYQVMQIGVEMFQVQIIIGILLDSYIVILCDDFLELCDSFNFDVIMDLVKF